MTPPPRLRYCCVMSTIDISRKNPLGLAVARERTEQLAKRMEEKFGLECKWSGNNVDFDAPKGMAKGTSGTIHLSQESVRVTVKLPLLLRGFKGKVEDRLNEELDKILK